MGGPRREGEASARQRAGGPRSSWERATRSDGKGPTIRGLEGSTAGWSASGAWNCTPRERAASSDCTVWTQLQLVGQAEDPLPEAPDDTESQFRSRAVGGCTQQQPQDVPQACPSHCQVANAGASAAQSSRASNAMNQLGRKRITGLL